MGYFYALKDLDWPWDDQYEGRAIIVEANTPEEAIQLATERHVKEFPGAGGVTWSIARVDDIGFCDAEWGGDNKPIYEAITRYSRPTGKTETTTADYLVWSNEHAAWWGPDHAGYYTRIEAAGRYSRALSAEVGKLREIERLLSCMDTDSPTEHDSLIFETLVNEAKAAIRSRAALDKSDET